MINPCKDLCHMKFGKQYPYDCDNKCEFAIIIEDHKMLEEEMNRSIKTLAELATQFCCLTECENCPVMIYDYEKRSKLEKENLHEPCCTNLYKWIIEQSRYK